MTGDELQVTMGRVQTAGDARCLLPAFLCAHISIEREASGYEALIILYRALPHDVMSAIISASKQLKRRLLLLLNNIRRNGSSDAL